jgi:2-polyprenyl-3-methyl-5-hydroxy-6-metoxy-1,4-benzoquinol methylase
MLRNRTKESREVLSKWIESDLNPSSLIEFGCGPSHVIEYFQDKIDVVGVDSFEDMKTMLPDNLSPLLILEDLENSKELDFGVFDVVVSTEVAEHISQKSEEAFLELLVRSGSKHLVFSASNKDKSPGHINPHPKSYWKDRIGAEWNEEKTTSVLEALADFKGKKEIVSNIMVFDI